MKIGFAELLVVLIVAMVFLGPEKLPYYARKIGKGMAEFRRASHEVADAFSKDVQNSTEKPESPQENRDAPPEGGRETVHTDSGKNRETD